MSGLNLQHFGLDIASPEEYRKRSVVELINDVSLKDVFEKKPLPGSVFDRAMEGPATESTLFHKCGHIELATPVLRPECAEQLKEYLLLEIGTNNRFSDYFNITKKGKPTYKNDESFNLMLLERGKDLYEILLNLDRIWGDERHVLISGNQTIEHNVKGAYAEMMLTVLPVPSIFARTIDDMTVGLSQKLNIILSVNNDLREYQKRRKKDQNELDRKIILSTLIYHVTTYIDNTIPNIATYENPNETSFYGIGQLIHIFHPFQNKAKAIGFEIAGTPIQRMVRNINSGERILNAYSGDCENLWFELSKQCALGKILADVSPELQLYYINRQGIIFKIEMEEIHGLEISPWSGSIKLPEDVILSARKSLPVEIPVHPRLKYTMQKIRDLDYRRAEEMSIHSQMIANFLFHEIDPQKDSISLNKLVVVNGAPDQLLCSTALQQLNDDVGLNTTFLFHTRHIADDYKQYGRFEYKATPDAYRNVIIALAELRSRNAFAKKIKFFDSRKPTEIIELSVLMKHIPRKQIMRILGSTLVAKGSFDQDYIRGWVKEICHSMDLDTDHLHPAERRKSRPPIDFEPIKHQLGSKILQEVEGANKEEEDGVKKLTFDSLKGLDPLVNWFVSTGRRFSPQAKEFGFTSYPKGVILTGVPGCGKTMAAKIVASEWKMNFRRIEVNDVTARYVGGNEAKMATLLKELEAAAPVVCFVDEAEKLFAQVRTGDLYQAGDAGRDGTESMLLQFMEENESGVFFIFTSNDLEKMSPALVDRFDERFFIDLPPHIARLQMIASMLQERSKNPADFDIHALANASNAFTGRNIRATIDAAMADAFGQNSELKDTHLIAAFSTTVPTTETHQDYISKMRQLVTTGKIRLANTNEQNKTVQPVFDPSVG